MNGRLKPFRYRYTLNFTHSDNHTTISNNIEIPKHPIDYFNPGYGFANTSLIHVIAAIALGRPIVVMASILTCIISSFDTSA